MEYIDDLKWRYATKQFDITRKILPQDLLKIKEAIQLAASSYGLQHIRFFVLKISNTLRVSSYDQSHDRCFSFLFSVVMQQLMQDILTSILLLKR